MKLFRKKKDSRPSMRIRLVSSLGSIAAILILSGVISIIEYRRMSDYVSDMIASNIKSINLSQRLADMTQEYNHQMLSVVLLNDISLMPEFDLGLFQSQADSLKSSVTSTASLPISGCGANCRWLFLFETISSSQMISSLPLWSACSVRKSIYPAISEIRNRSISFSTSSTTSSGSTML